MPNLGPMEWILILLVLVLLFGAKKLPEMARGLGRGLRIFKSEVNAMKDDEPTTTVQQQPPPQQGQQGVQAQPLPSPTPVQEPTVDGVPLSEAQKGQRQ